MYVFITVFAYWLPVALQNWATERCYSNCSGRAVGLAPSTCLNADSFPVEPAPKTDKSDWMYTK